MGMSGFPGMCAWAQGPKADSGKPQALMLQQIYSTWVTHLQVWETDCLFFKWDRVNFDCG